MAVGRKSYAVSKGDEDIKWQWEVRESPCTSCHLLKKKKKGFFAKLLKKKKTAEDELTNRHKEVVYKPKIWEWSYYSYLLPECEIQTVPKKDLCKDCCEPTYGHFQSQNSNLVCPPRKKHCDGKEELVSLNQDHAELKAQTQKLSISLKEPFCLNEVCGQKKAPKKGKVEDDFVCLNNLIENKPNDGDTGKNKKEC